MTSTKLTFAKLKTSSVALATLLALGSQVSHADDDEYTFFKSIQEGKSLSSVRLRYESVDQDTFQAAPNANQKLDTAHAFTARTLLGWQTAPFHNFSFGVQLTDVHEFNDDFNDRRSNTPEHNNGTASASLFKRQFANIVDPGFTDLNQLYVDWTGIKNTKFRVGRQQLNLDNVRFIGDIAFRQNMQVFDGFSVWNKSIPDTELYAGYFSKVRQINAESRDADTVVLNAKYRISPSESLVGYGYMIDAPNLSQNGGNPNAIGTAAQGGNGLGGSSDLKPSAANFKPYETDASSKTFGLRLDGVHPINPDFKVLYTAEYAKQTDYKDGSDLIDAHYFKVGGGAVYDIFSLRIDHEVLSSNNGKYAFQTPMGTNHLFQGWADHFLVTPRQGIKDTFVTAAITIEKAKIYAEYHVFKSDEKFQTLGFTPANKVYGDKYGTEFDISAAYPFTDKISGKLEYARFNEDDVFGTTLKGATAAARKADKEVIWATAQYTF